MAKGEIARASSGGAEGVSLHQVNLSGKRTLVGRHSGENAMAASGGRIVTQGETRTRTSPPGQLSGTKDRAIGLASAAD